MDLSSGRYHAAPKLLPGHAVKLYDENKSSTENAINKINKVLDRLIEKGKISKSDYLKPQESFL